MDLSKFLSSRLSFRSGVPAAASRQPPNHDPLGLQLVTDQENPSADIIFIHGLGGSAFRTWSWQRNPNNFWPRWLAHDKELGSCRVFTFGYDANFKGNAHGLDILDFAKDLLLQMLNYPEALGKNRPILFVVHSMGGLVAKKAYILGKHDKRFAGFISSVVGIVFLATPHRGSQYAKTLGNIIASAPVQVPPKLYLSALEHQSPVLQDINEVFSHQCEGLQLVSFHETLPVKLGFMKLIIVNKGSAILGYENEISAPMNADHNSICKYENGFDPNYIKLRDTLGMMLPKASTAESIPKPDTHVIKEIQDILGVFDISRDDTYQRYISPDSGSWLACERGCASWLQATTGADSPCVYWLLGLPGSGKTILSNIIIDRLQRRNQSLQFHFFSEAHQTHRSIAYGLRSIAMQLALEDATFGKALLTLHRETGFVFNSENQSFHGIWQKIFADIIFQIDFPRPLIWVLDGIDEADEPDTLLSYVSQIQSRAPIKIFLSSRPLKAISRFESSQIRSYFLRQDDTAEDMRKYAAKALRQTLPANEELLHHMVDQTMKNSSGSFLWVKLAVEALGDNWHTQEDIWAVLNSLPGGMIPTYNRMVSKVESQTPRNCNMARLILTWAACSWRPLRLEELQTALEPEFRNFVNLEETVTQICGHFVSISRISDTRKHVSLIHKTARDFLVGDSLSAGQMPFINLQDGHHHLALVCLHYLSSQHWRRHFNTIHVTTRSSVLVGRGSNRLLLAGEDYPLLCYAACYWSYHVSKAPVAAPELLQALKVFVSKHLLSWFEAIFLSGNLEYLTRAAQHLKTYASRHLRSRRDTEQGVKFLQDWATDIIRIVRKFGSNLISDPPSLYRHLPAFCPKNSMIGKTYGISRQDSPSFNVTGIESEGWDDCIASVQNGTDDYITQVLATETCFATLVSSNGAIVVWDAETCEKLRTINIGGYVPLMKTNKAGTAIAVATFDSYSVWDLLSGRRLYHCAKRNQALVLDLRFGSADSELVVGLNTNTIARVNLQTGDTAEFHIVLPSDSDFSYLGCPWRTAFSPDLTKIAAAWRGRPPLIWDLLPTGPSSRPRKCFVSDSSNSICGAEMLLWHPNGEVLFVMCQDMKVVEWRILDDEQKEWDQLMAREMALSNDGRFLMTSDSAGTISIWHLPGLNLVYRLINENGLCNDVAFSPGGHRFYDIRGSACNVFEPGALMRVHGDGRDHEALTEPTISHFDAGGQLITALALDAADRYYCCGREDGKVWIHDALNGKRLRKVYSHRASASVTGMMWSKSGKYMASSDDGGYVIVKRLQVKEEGAWGVFPVVDRRLGDEAVTQFLFSDSEEYLLISTPRADHVWNLKAKKEVKIRQWPERQIRRWIQHPGQKDILVWLNPGEIRCHRWPELDLVGQEVPSSSGSLAAPADKSPQQPPSSDAHGSADRSRCVSWAAVTADRQSIIYTTIPNDGYSIVSCLPINNLQIKVVDTSSILKESGDYQPATRQCAPGVAVQAKRLLGMYKTSLVFLDNECWVCTWNTQDETGRVTRHFFIPKDWAHTSTSYMTAVNRKGTLFCPRYGEVGIVRNGIRI